MDTINVPLQPVHLKCLLGMKRKLRETFRRKMMRSITNNLVSNIGCNNNRATHHANAPHPDLYLTAMPQNKYYLYIEILYIYII